MSKPNAKLSNLTDGFRSAMLVTHDQDGSLRARPMALAEVEDPKVLWFATLQTSGKVDELRDDSRVAVTLQGSKRQVSLTGRAEVVIDADKIDAMWKDSWQVWFPEGRDSAIALVKVSVECGEEWDATRAAAKWARVLPPLVLLLLPPPRRRRRLLPLPLVMVPLVLLPLVLLTQEG